MNLLFAMLSYYGKNGGNWKEDLVDKRVYFHSLSEIDKCVTDRRERIHLKSETGVSTALSSVGPETPRV